MSSPRLSPAHGSRNGSPSKLGPISPPSRFGRVTADAHLSIHAPPPACLAVGIHPITQCGPLRHSCELAHRNDGHGSGNRDVPTNPARTRHICILASAAGQTQTGSLAPAQPKLEVVSRARPGRKRVESLREPMELEVRQPASDPSVMRRHVLIDESGKRLVLRRVRLVSGPLRLPGDMPSEPSLSRQPAQSLEATTNADRTRAQDVVPAFLEQPVEMVPREKG